jgi:hypothetical protein
MLRASGTFCSTRATASSVTGSGLVKYVDGAQKSLELTL